MGRCVRPDSRHFPLSQSSPHTKLVCLCGIGPLPHRVRCRRRVSSEPRTSCPDLSSSMRQRAERFVLCLVLPLVGVNLAAVMMEVAAVICGWTMRAYRFVPLLRKWQPCENMARCLLLPSSTSKRAQQSYRAAALRQADRSGAGRGTPRLSLLESSAATTSMTAWLMVELTVRTASSLLPARNNTRGDRAMVKAKTKIACCSRSGEVTGKTVAWPRLLGGSDSSFKPRACTAWRCTHRSDSCSCISHG